MDKVENFLELINVAKKVTQDQISKNLTPQYTARYNSIVKFLDSIYNATSEGKLYRKFLYLEIVKLLNENDPSELENAILAVNKYYCNFFRELI